MSNILDLLKEKRKVMKEKQKAENDKRQNNDLIQFYQDSLKFENSTTGMVTLITEDKVIKGFVPAKCSHMKICQELLDAYFPDKKINLSKVDGDFGETIPLEFNSIFIRSSSILNGPTIIYYPHVCNKYQIEKLSEFNEQIKEYNSGKREIAQVFFEYNGKSDDVVNHLDSLIGTLNFRLEREKNKKVK